MKSFIQQVAHKAVKKVTQKSLVFGALGALSASALSVGVVGTLGSAPAIAIPESSISEKLANVPVYVIRNGEGLLLVPGQEEDQQARLLVFMGRTEAEGLLAEANEANPELAANLQLASTSLDKIYEEFQSGENESLRLMYVPERAEASQASSVSTDYQGGVPLFYPQLEDGTLAAIPDSTGENVFPMFFSYEDLDLVLNDIAAQNPEARAAITVGILPLEDMLYEMQTNDDDKLNQVRLLPDSEVINDIVESGAATTAPAE